MRLNIAREKLCKMAVNNDYYVPKQNNTELKHQHQVAGSDAMLNNILTELGPEFFSDAMKMDPEEKAREDRRKFEALRRGFSVNTQSSSSCVAGMQCTGAKWRSCHG